MENVIDFPLDVNVFRHIIVNELEVLAPHQVADIINTSCEKVVHTDNSVALPDKSITEMRAKEASTPRDDTDSLRDSHHGIGWRGCLMNMSEEIKRAIRGVD
jgi:hypothetical protein